MPGHRNPLRISGLVDTIQGFMSNLKGKSNVSNVSETLAKEKDYDIPMVDLVIQVSIDYYLVARGRFVDADSVAVHRGEWVAQDGCHRLRRPVFYRKARR